MRFVVSAAALLLGIGFVCAPTFADDGNTSAIDQLGAATSGDQTLSQTYGDQGHDESCPEACPTGDVNVPEPPPPTPVDSGNDNSGNSDSGSDGGG
jgi:hypothetical protein